MRVYEDERSMRGKHGVGRHGLWLLASNIYKAIYGGGMGPFCTQYMVLDSDSLGTLIHIAFIFIIMV